jgi:hypothetical protein
MSKLRDLAFRSFHVFADLLPSPIMSRMLRAMYYFPEIANRQGYVVMPQVYYSPYPDPREVVVEKLTQRRHLPGVNFNMAETSRLMGELIKLSRETQDFMNQRPANTLKFWDETYPVGDSATLYAMLRHLKPKNYIEVGCGWSSRCSTAALDRNRAEGHACKATYIEPVPPAHLSEVKLPGEFLKKKIQDVPFEVFLRLEAGDVLFIDTSHVIKCQNDCEFEFIQLLPLLKPGVIVQIHDIWTPYDYPLEWTVGPGIRRGGSNEQYAVECLLSGGADWEVILPLFQLWMEQGPLLAQLVPPNQYSPKAFWIKKVRRTIPENKV